MKNMSTDEFQLFLPNRYPCKRLANTGYVVEARFHEPENKNCTGHGLAISTDGRSGACCNSSEEINLVVNR